MGKVAQIPEVGVEETTMQQPDPRLGAGALAAANCQRRPTTESTPTTRASAPTTSQRMRPAVEPMWNQSQRIPMPTSRPKAGTKPPHNDDDQEAVERDDLRGDAARSGADADHI
jgi:hypothetical protein